MMDMHAGRIGFVGAGNMAEAIVRGMLHAELVPAAQLLAFDCAPERGAVFAQLGVAMAPDNRTLASACDTLFLAVKPQVLDGVLAEFAPTIRSGTLVISICAGVTCARIERQIPDSARVVRVMPNTPMLVGKGVAGVSAGTRATDSDVDWTLRVFSAAGVARRVPEADLDAVTALSGSGPAYVFRFVELLAQAGVKAGLPEDIACDFARETVIGSARLLAESDESPEALRKKVTSPGGTTAAALAAFDDRGFADVIAAAVEAARRRSRELAG